MNEIGITTDHDLRISKVDYVNGAMSLLTYNLVLSQKL